MPARDHESQVHFEPVVRGHHSPERGNGDLFPFRVIDKRVHELDREELKHLVILEEKQEQAYLRRWLS